MTLDDIKRALKRASVNGMLKPGEYPKMIALLERLKEPTEYMKKEGMLGIIDCDDSESYEMDWAVAAYKRMLKAAEEAK